MAVKRPSVTSPKPPCLHALCTICRLFSTAHVYKWLARRHCSTLLMQLQCNQQAHSCGSLSGRGSTTTRCPADSCCTHLLASKQPSSQTIACMQLHLTHESTAVNMTLILMQQNVLQMHLLFGLHAAHLQRGHNKQQIALATAALTARWSACAPLTVVQ